MKKGAVEAGAEQRWCRAVSDAFKSTVAFIFFNFASTNDNDSQNMHSIKTNGAVF